MKHIPLLFYRRCSGNLYIGRLVGRNQGTILNCYSTGNASGIFLVGGLVGWNYVRAIISNCYSVGKATGRSKVSRLIGWNEWRVSNSFWGIESSGLSISDGWTGKTTENMKDIRTYTDTTWSEGLVVPWDIVEINKCENDFSHIWNIINYKSYPFLGWEENKKRAGNENKSNKSIDPNHQHYIFVLES